MSRIIILSLCCLFFRQVSSQSCYPGFDYRRSVQITNPNAVPYTDFQVAVEVNTASLLAAGKVKYNGDDFRFKDNLGNVLSYWFDPETYNQASTTFWVKVPVLDATTTYIYIYYGNPSAGPVSSGEATFDLFDTFNDITVDALKWDKYGTNTNFDLVGGKAIFTAYQTPAAIDSLQALLISKDDFSYPLIAEMNTESVSNGEAIIGLVAQTVNEGYGTGFRSNQALIMGVNGGPTPTLNILPSPSALTGAQSNGIWSFNWPLPNEQNCNFPNVAAYSGNETSNSANFGLGKQVVLGVESGSFPISTLQVEWVRARKYAVAEPTTIKGTEERYPNSVNLSSTGPYCAGETFNISADVFAGAVYTWKKNSVIMGSNTTASFNIASVSTNDQALYSVDIEMLGCIPVNASLQVDVANASDAGTINPSTILILCSGDNLETLLLDGSNGSVSRWEMSSSLIGPWLPLLETTTSLSFQNLLDTTYYRAVVQSGSCPEVKNDPPYRVDVNSPTVGGFVLGSKSVCSGESGGVINLVFENGNILWWESSNDNFVSPGVYQGNVGSSNFMTPILSQTTQYRARLRSGVCNALYSATAEITVYENPVPIFTYTTECIGFNTDFVDDASTSVDGAIIKYSWSFGNGSGSISHNPSYVYPAANIGGYLVELTIETDKGCTAIKTENVPVYPLPVIDFDPDAICIGNPMIFALTPSSIPASQVSMYDWDFGDGIGTDFTSPTSYDYISSGSFDVELTVQSNLGCIDSITKEVYVNTPVAISFNCDSVCLGSESTFINTSVSADPTVQYLWYFEPNATSPLTNPTYTYADTGTYIVALTAEVGSGTSACSGTITDTVVIYEVPQTDFTFTNVCQADSSEFISTTVFSSGESDLLFAWDFDDATTSSAENVKHKYMLPNTYDVELTTTSLNGCSSSISKLVSIYYMPNASFTFGDVCLGNPTIFANGSNITSGTLTYFWDFGDLSIPQTDYQPGYQYGSDSLYNVQLIATSEEFCDDTVNQIIAVHPLPIVGFIADAVCHFSTSVFDDTSSINTQNSNALLSSYSWDFGDGSSSTSTDPQHNYLNDQTYNVTLEIESNQGCVSQLTKQVIVNSVPVADFEIEDACVGAPVLFTNNTQLNGGTILYDWDFGDNNTDIATNPINYYAIEGLYQVWLVATSGEGGCVDSIPKYAEVFSLPLPNAGLDTSVSQGFTVDLEGYYPGAISYNWTPSETLNNNTISNPEATPLVTTTYYLEVTDINGCINSDSVEITAIEDFKLFIHNVITPDGNGMNDTWKITNIETFSEADVFVFDRWGLEVLRVIGYQNDWGGVSGTDQLPDGTYYYIIKVSESDKVYKGALTVLRNK